MNSIVSLVKLRNVVEFLLLDSQCFEISDKDKPNFPSPAYLWRFTLQFSNLPTSKFEPICLLPGGFEIRYSIEISL